MYIPKLMCTQHPDATERIFAQQEVDEAIQAYTMYRCDEVMSDYEGKLTPYAQPKEIVIRAINLDIPIGDKVFITPRVPNPSLEDFDRVDLSIEAGFIANYYSAKLIGVQAVKWFILPMVEDPNIVRFVQRLILRKLNILREELGINLDPIQLIPLVENVQDHIHVKLHVKVLLSVLKEFNTDMEILRVFLGKSDAAVKAGHIASALSIMYALNELKKLSTDLGIEVKPIIGMGVPPFRGALNNPELVEYIVQRYKGFSTATIQSAIRYDIPFKDYVVVRNTIMKTMNSEPIDVDSEIVELTNKATELYRESASRYINIIQKIAEAVPATRDRISWKEYGRLLPAQSEKFSVPRAIVYTATWYSVGVPPIYLDADLIIELYKKDELDHLLKLVPHLEKEWLYDSRFYVRSVALKRLDDNIVNKIDEALDILGIKPEPSESYRVLIELNPVEPHIIALGRIRGFLG